MIKLLTTMTITLFLSIVYIVHLTHQITTNSKTKAKDDRESIIEMIIEHPEVFKIPNNYLLSIKTLYGDYKQLTKENINKYDYGYTLDIAKNTCLTRALDLLGNSITKDFRSYKAFSIGGLNHSILAYSIGLEKYTNEEVNTYMDNMSKILEAIPKNLPPVEAMTQRGIVRITYYEDYAKIVWKVDNILNYINHEETSFTGKRYIGKLKEK